MTRFMMILIKSKVRNIRLFCLKKSFEACNEFAGPFSASLSAANTASFKETLQRWRAVGITGPNLTGLRFEPLTSRFKDERVTARILYKNSI